MSLNFLSKSSDDRPVAGRPVCSKCPNGGGATDGPGDGTRWKLSRWPDRVLPWTYAHGGASQYIEYDEAMESIRAAFEMWQPYFPLEFREVKIEFQGLVGIAIGWYQYDGKGNVLGQAELPIWHYPRTSRIFLDAAEHWTADSQMAMLQPMPHFETVVGHEIGHALGLEHLPEGTDGLMAPYYKGPRGIGQADKDALIAEYFLEVEALKDKNTAPVGPDPTVICTSKSGETNLLDPNAKPLPHAD